MQSWEWVGIAWPFPDDLASACQIAGEMHCMGIFLRVLACLLYTSTWLFLWLLHAAKPARYWASMQRYLLVRRRNSVQLYLPLVATQGVFLPKSWMVHKRPQDMWINTVNTEMGVYFSFLELEEATCWDWATSSVTLRVKSFSLRYVDVCWNCLERTMCVATWKLPGAGAAWAVAGTARGLWSWGLRIQIRKGSSKVCGTEMHGVFPKSLICSIWRSGQPVGPRDFQKHGNQNGHETSWNPDLF